MKLELLHDIPLSGLHTFALPGQAREAITLTSKSDCELLPSENDYFVLGEGSNTLFIENLVIPLVLMRIKGVTYSEREDVWIIKAGAGENWHQLVIDTLERGIGGFENLSLIPGTVGAAPVQNIGAYGVEVERFVDEVEVWDRQTLSYRTLTREDCDFGYRDSLFKRHPRRFIILYVTFALPKHWRPTLSYGDLKKLPADASATTVATEVIRIRQSKLPDPQQLPNAGSFFKNPVVSAAKATKLSSQFGDIPAYDQADGRVKLAAGWLIEHAGLKGYQLGGARVHDRQALVLTNYRQASGADVLQLADYILAEINARFGVQLEVEVRLLDQAGIPLL